MAESDPRNIMPEDIADNPEDLGAEAASFPEGTDPGAGPSFDADPRFIEAGDGDQGDGPEADAGPPDWESEARRLEDLYLRTLAEAENAKRRFQREREETSRYATEGVLRDLLPFLDTLNLALDYADNSNPAVKSLAEGVAMTLKGCLDKLADWGLKEVGAALGQPFDPNFQEAIGQMPDPALPDMSVGRLAAKGYTLHGRLLRPAKVLVVKNPAPGQA